VIISEPEHEQSIEFRPRPSNGMRWSGGIGLSVVLMFAIPSILIAYEAHVLVTIPFLIVGVATTAPILVVAWYFPRMRYQVTEDSLYLNYGPLMNDRIPIQDITAIWVQDLKPSMLASFRFPGLALFDVDYVDRGRIRMCATSASKNILLIQAGRKRYGITPEDPRTLTRELITRSDGSVDVAVESMDPELAATTIW
jgi:hypothetical protein